MSSEHKQPNPISKFVHYSRLRQEEKLRADALFSSIGEGIITTNESGRIERVNEAATTILGYSARDLIGKWFPEVVQAVKENGTPINKIDRPITRAFLTGKPVAERMYYKTKDGSIVPVQVNVAPIIQDNRPIGTIEIFRDISLEMQVDKIKTEFISLASHQLRTPLSAINTYSHLLAEGYAGDLNEGQMAFVNTILSSVARMNDLINTLLNVTRVEAGTINVNARLTDVVRLAKNLVNEFQAEAIEHDVTLRLSVAKHVPKVKTDSLLVREVLSNLISNSIKYTPPHGKVVLAIDAKGDNITFAVRDNGFGIPDTAKQYIFSKFFRAPNVVARDVGGTGLGLYLTKIVAEYLDGDMWFKSRENVGTVFYFSLPKQGTRSKTGKFKLETL